MLVKRIKSTLIVIVTAIVIMITYPSILEISQNLSPSDDNSSSFNEPRQEDPNLNRNYPYGGTLVIGARDTPTIINPILTTHTISLDLMNIIFNHLVRINAHGHIEPEIAERWNVSEDGLTYTFYLRKDVVFHDGKKCTAEDILFTYEQLKNHHNQSPYRTHFDLVERFEMINDYTLRIILSKPFPSFLNKLAEREIVPQHILEGQDLHETVFNYAPIGTGPFKFKSWDPETHQIALIANSDYFEGRPYLDKIIVKVIQPSRLWSSFMREEIDLMLFINHEDYKVLKKDAAFKVYKIILDKYFAIAFNTNDSIFRDPQVRKAISHAIPRQEIIDETFPGGIESLGPFHPRSLGFNPEIRPLSYNPVKAKVNLSHRGWIDNDGDGILEKEDRELEMRMLVDGRSDIYEKMAMIIRQQLAEVGIKLKIQFFQDEDDLTEEFLREKRPQAWLRFFNSDESRNYEAARNWYSSSSELFRLWDYKNKHLDQLFELGRAAPNALERGKIYQEIHKIVYEDQPACFLFFPVSYHAVSSEFHNTESFFPSICPCTR